jgi:thymidylate kinase
LWNQQFFIVIVGAPGAGKGVVFWSLQKKISSFTDRCVFLCDSSLDDQDSRVRCTTSFTRVVGEVYPNLGPRSRYLLGAAELTRDVEENVAPALREGYSVLFKGFGATNYARNAVLTKTEEEHSALLSLHEAFVTSLRYIPGMRIPDLYLHLRVNAEVASRRLRPDQELFHLDQSRQYKHIEAINAKFERYPQLFPGQRVKTIDANRDLDLVVAEAFSYIEPMLVSAVA